MLQARLRAGGSLHRGVAAEETPLWPSQEPKVTYQLGEPQENDLHHVQEAGDCPTRDDEACSDACPGGVVLAEFDRSNESPVHIEGSQSEEGQNVHDNHETQGADDGKRLTNDSRSCNSSLEAKSGAFYGACGGYSDTPPCLTAELVDIDDQMSDILEHRTRRFVHYLPSAPVREIDEEDFISEIMVSGQGDVFQDCFDTLLRAQCVNEMHVCDFSKASAQEDRGTVSSVPSEHLIEPPAEFCSDENACADDDPACSSQLPADSSATADHNGCPSISPPATEELDITHSGDAGSKESCSPLSSDSSIQIVEIDTCYGVTAANDDGQHAEIIEVTSESDTDVNSLDEVTISNSRSSCSETPTREPSLILDGERTLDDHTEGKSDMTVEPIETEAGLDASQRNPPGEDIRIIPLSLRNENTSETGSERRFPQETGISQMCNDAEANADIGESTGSVSSNLTHHSSTELHIQPSSLTVGDGNKDHGDANQNYVEQHVKIQDRAINNERNNAEANADIGESTGSVGSNLTDHSSTELHIQSSFLTVDHGNKDHGDANQNYGEQHVKIQDRAINNERSNAEANADIGESTGNVGSNLTDHSSTELHIQPSSLTVGDGNKDHGDANQNYVEQHVKIQDRAINNERNNAEANADIGESTGSVGSNLTDHSSTELYIQPSYLTVGDGNKDHGDADQNYVEQHVKIQDRAINNETNNAEANAAIGESTGSVGSNLTDHSSTELHIQPSYLTVSDGNKDHGDADQNYAEQHAKIQDRAINNVRNLADGGRDQNDVDIFSKPSCSVVPCISSLVILCDENKYCRYKCNNELMQKPLIQESTDVESSEFAAKHNEEDNSIITSSCLTPPSQSLSPTLTSEYTDCGYVTANSVECLTEAEEKQNDSDSNLDSMNTSVSLQDEQSFCSLHSEVSSQTFCSSNSDDDCAVGNGAEDGTTATEENKEMMPRAADASNYQQDQFLKQQILINDPWTEECSADVSAAGVANKTYNNQEKNGNLDTVLRDAQVEEQIPDSEDDSMSIKSLNNDHLSDASFVSDLFPTGQLTDSDEALTTSVVGTTRPLPETNINCVDECDQRLVASVVVTEEHYVLCENPDTRLNQIYIGNNVSATINRKIVSQDIKTQSSEIAAGDRFQGTVSTETLDSQQYQAVNVVQSDTSWVTVSTISSSELPVEANNSFQIIAGTKSKSENNAGYLESFSVNAERNEDTESYESYTTHTTELPVEANTSSMIIASSQNKSREGVGSSSDNSGRFRDTLAHESFTKRSSEVPVRTNISSPSIASTQNKSGEAVKSSSYNGEHIQDTEACESYTKCSSEIKIEEIISILAITGIEENSTKHVKIPSRNAESIRDMVSCESYFTRSAGLPVEANTPSLDTAGIQNKVEESTEHLEISSDNTKSIRDTTSYERYTTRCSGLPVESNIPPLIIPTTQDKVDNSTEHVEISSDKAECIRHSVLCESYNMCSSELPVEASTSTLVIGNIQNNVDNSSYDVAISSGSAKCIQDKTSYENRTTRSLGFPVETNNPSSAIADTQTKVENCADQMEISTDNAESIRDTSLYESYTTSYSGLPVEVNAKSLAIPSIQNEVDASTENVEISSDNAECIRLITSYESYKTRSSGLPVETNNPSLAMAENQNMAESSTEHVDTAESIRDTVPYDRYITPSSELPFEESISPLAVGVIQNRREGCAEHLESSSYNAKLIRDTPSYESFTSEYDAVPGNLEDGGCAVVSSEETSDEIPLGEPSTSWETLSELSTATEEDARHQAITTHPQQRRRRHRRDSQWREAREEEEARTYDPLDLASPEVEVHLSEALSHSESEQPLLPAASGLRLVNVGTAAGSDSELLVATIAGVALADLDADTQDSADILYGARDLHNAAMEAAVACMVENELRDLTALPYVQRLGGCLLLSEAQAEPEAEEEPEAAQGRQSPTTSQGSIPPEDDANCRLDEASLSTMPLIPPSTTSPMSPSQSSPAPDDTTSNCSLR